ncbi:MAG: hypothetical protein DLM62_12490 [Pseudonocardiales bacterium]|nr:MAG: hypothetical protein DLM62_12490 [Pseudonocardiales bacterium]
MTNGTNHVPATTSTADRVLTPAQALVELFMTNADRGRNAENDLFVEELLRRRREVQVLANPIGR